MPDMLLSGSFIIPEAIFAGSTEPLLAAAASGCSVTALSCTDSSVFTFATGPSLSAIATLEADLSMAIPASEGVVLITCC
jgi:hypothetical protein